VIVRCCYCRVVFVADDKDHVTSPLPVQTEREKEVVQQLKQATDTAARQQDELRQAAHRETQLQRQLDKMKDDVSQLQMELQEKTYAAARQQDVIRQAADRETQLQRQLDKLQTQLKQEIDTAARPQDELRQAAGRGTLLQTQLDKLQTELQQETFQRYMLCKEFDDFKKYYNAEHGRFFDCVPVLIVLTQ